MGWWRCGGGVEPLLAQPGNPSHLAGQGQRQRGQAEDEWVDTHTDQASRAGGMRGAGRSAIWWPGDAGVGMIDLLGLWWCRFTAVGPGRTVSGLGASERVKKSVTGVPNPTVIGRQWRRAQFALP